MIIAVIGDQDRGADRAHEIIVNADLGHVTAVVGQGHVIDDADRGRVIAVNTDLGHILENVCDRKSNVVTTVPTLKNNL